MFSFGAGFYDLAANDIIIHPDLFPITIDRELQTTVALPIIKLLISLPKTSLI